MKKYMCPECKKVSSQADWNRETYLSFMGGIDTIESPQKDGSYYICPKCGREMDGAIISEMPEVGGKHIKEMGVLFGGVGYSVIFNSSNLQRIKEVIEKEWRKSEIGFGEFMMGSVKLSGFVEDILLVTGELLKEHEGDHLIRVNSEEEWFEVFEEAEKPQDIDGIKQYL